MKKKRAGVWAVYLHLVEEVGLAVLAPEHLTKKIYRNKINLEINKILRMGMEVSGDYPGDDLVGVGERGVAVLAAVDGARRRQC